MIGLDTNVLVRYVMQDDPKQSQKASRLIESLTSEAPGFVPLVSLIELVWVLTACYDLTRKQIGQALEALLRAKEIVLERAEQVSAGAAYTRRRFRGFCRLPHRTHSGRGGLREDDDL